MVPRHRRSTFGLRCHWSDGLELATSQPSRSGDQ